MIALALTAAGYRIWGWALVAGVVFVVTGLAGVISLLVERRRMNRALPSAPERQGRPACPGTPQHSQ